MLRLILVSCFIFISTEQRYTWKLILDLDYSLKFSARNKFLVLSSHASSSLAAILSNSVSFASTLNSATLNICHFATTSVTWTIRGKYWNHLLWHQMFHWDSFLLKHMCTLACYESHCRIITSVIVGIWSGKVLWCVKILGKLWNLILEEL